MNSTRWRQRKAQLWSSLQIVFLAVAVVAPLWVTNNQRLLPELHEARLKASDDLRPSTITSSTILLPNPASISSIRALEFESRSRQVRLAQPPDAARDPSSESLWTLSRVKRLGGVTEVISLLPSQPPSTEFLEVQEGTNRFLVSFSNAKGQSREYEVMIRYLSQN